MRTKRSYNELSSLLEPDNTASIAAEQSHPSGRQTMMIVPVKKRVAALMSFMAATTALIALFVMISLFLQWTSDSLPTVSFLSFLVLPSLDALKKLHKKEESQSWAPALLPPAFPSRNDNANGFAVKDQPGFFGYSPGHSMIQVSYNNRSILVSYPGDSDEDQQQHPEPLFLLGGSIHPVRHTPATWARALDEAVRVGFNLVTIYIMWSAHEPFSDSPWNWNLPGSDLVCHGKNGNGDDGDESSSSSSSCWTLATAIQQAAERRLWVHLRIGPYVCAEYNYGGLPEWVAAVDPKDSENNKNMSMRRPNRPWLNAMERFVQNTTAYISQHGLWAHQGGNILLGQIENELQGEIDLKHEHIMWTTPDGELVDHHTPGGRRANLQDYANWCGKLVQNLEPNVVWTMCQGLSAPNTIETFNGLDGSDWLDQNGSTHRVQVEVPALWTEFEGGFQIWGEEADNPTDYFWGQSGRQYAARALRWIARGGTHINYYMFAGGYNRGRMAAAGIMNMYASDALLCPSGEPRQPKFDHLQRVHFFLRDYATLWLEFSRARPERVQVKDIENNTWTESTDKILLFRYHNETTEIVFIENMQNEPVLVRWDTNRSGRKESTMAELQPWSVSVYHGVDLKLDSSQIVSKAKEYERRRRRIDLPPAHESANFSLLKSCEEGVIDTLPVEQTQLMLESRNWTDYAWYATEWFQENALADGLSLKIETQLSNAFVLWLNGQRVAWNDTHPHREDSVTLSFSLPALEVGRHRLAVLSESLGYDNVIGVWGASTTPKIKGITGDVYLETKMGNQSLLEGNDWCSCAGLTSCLKYSPRYNAAALRDPAVLRTSWRFPKPALSGNERLFVHISRGRGHFFLNGLDLGRYWNITRPQSGRYSQTNYLLPTDYLMLDNNELSVENVFGESPGDVHLIASDVVAGKHSRMEDVVDFQRACI